MAARTCPTGSPRWAEFRLLTAGDELPVFAFTTADDVAGFDVFDVSRRLRERGWLVPAYTFPADRTDLAVLRIVVRNGFSHDLADLFFHDLRAAHPGCWPSPRRLRPAGAPPDSTTDGT